MEIVEILEVHRRLRAFDPTYGENASDSPVFALPAEEVAETEPAEPARTSPLALDIATLVTQQRAIG